MDIRPINAIALKHRVLNSTPDVERFVKCDIMHAYIDQETTLSLNTLRDAIYEDAVKHGLWNENDGPIRCACRIGEEVEELIEEAGNVLDVRLDAGDETEVWAAYCEELADVIITGFSVAGHLSIDIDAEIRHKMEKNKQRTWKHGKE